MATQRVYTYPQVADRLEQELGVRPSLSSLRAAASEVRRRGSRAGMPRVTMGLPPPERRSSATAPAVFSQMAIEAWLTHHPRRQYVAAVEALTRVSFGPRPYREGEARRAHREELIRRARQVGVSWADIAQALSGPVTKIDKPLAYRRFQHLDER